MIRSWPPGLPVFGLLTPYPATPLYERLALSNRFIRPRHWLDFKPFSMVFSPLGISSAQAEAEVRESWASSYSPAANASAMQWLESRPLCDRIIHLLSRLAFRGIYFPQMKRRDWAKILFQNRGAILKIILQALQMKRRSRMKKSPWLDDTPSGQKKTCEDSTPING
jgi:hypothetical protein